MKKQAKTKIIRFFTCLALAGCMPQDQIPNNEIAARNDAERRCAHWQKIKKEFGSEYVELCSSVMIQCQKDRFGSSCDNDKLDTCTTIARYYVTDPAEKIDPMEKFCAPFTKKGK